MDHVFFGPNIEDRMEQLFYLSECALLGTPKHAFWWLFNPKR